ncbi:MAG: hypothetical protein AB7D37_21025 [Desulfovibrio sp.]
MKYLCETCRFRALADKRPASLWARLWRWHTGWCPGWKRYQKALAAGKIVEKRP